MFGALCISADPLQLTKAGSNTLGTYSSNFLFDFHLEPFEAIDICSWCPELIMCKYFL